MLEVENIYILYYTLILMSYKIVDEPNGATHLV